MLPGIYRASGAELDLITRIRAAVLYDPNAIVVGDAAATLGWWPQRAASTVELAASGRRPDGDGITWCRRSIPIDLTVDRGDVRFTDAPLTVLDLLPSLGGSVIDEALRRRAVTLSQLQDVFAGLPRRRGDILRRQLLEDSRDEPWSEAERYFQRYNRELDLPYRHHTNYRIALPDGTIRFLDYALPDLMLAFEVDGWEFHGTRAAFVADRAHDARLAAMGWQVVRFDAVSIFATEERVKETIRAVVTARAALCRGLR
ncbi:endonuclease domain-containing protein [Propioniciclava sinopodophylli]|uniref:endonuclease domain-containing protein n=1 Tax=Propioniciclava sinopodophylli TaxID=1837344 RepID=UPI0024930D6E|nr:hypothetical protein [Propioniciclava sinopodophylli]